MFHPPLHPDELHDALKMEYPLFNTRRDRLAQAIINFCLQEQTFGARHSRSKICLNYNIE